MGGSALKATSVGLGLRGPHIAEVIASRPSVGWFEVHAENYMDGVPGRRQLDRVRCDYPISLHGVGLSLGSAGGLESRHLHRLKQLSDECAPAFVSEHLSWSSNDGRSVNDLLPLPYTEEALDIVGRNIQQAQDVLGRRILIENPSSYLRYRHSTISECEFLSALARRTGCGVLCDLNNIHVTCENFKMDAIAYIDGLDPAVVGEIHLAGHHRTEQHGRTLLIDDHGSAVSPEVWELYRHAVERYGPVPTLIEWDQNLPTLAHLVSQARLAEAHIETALRASGDRHAFAS